MNPRLPAMVLILAATAALHAQFIDLDTLDWQKVRDAQPEGVTLALELPKTTFHQGEQIDAKLTFENTSAAPYHLWVGTYDRSGRIPDIVFSATDETGARVPDPLHWYFSRGGMMGGLGNTQDLGKWSITLAANQWLRFDKPGTYVLRAYSNRLQKGDKLERKGRSPETQVELVSDPITITITPLSPDEEKRIIADALAQLTGSGEGVQKAAETLRFLGTPASRVALLPFLTSDALGFSALMALSASPDPAGEAPAILEAVRAGKIKSAPNLAHTYASLKTAAFHFGPMPRTREEVEARRAELEARGREYQAAIQAATDEITDAATAATGGTGPDYYETVINRLFQDPEKRPQIRAELVKLQLDLTPEQGEKLLNSWRDFGGDDFLPLVRKLVGPPTYSPGALKALAQSKPAEARPLIIEDIQRRPPRYLVPKSVPQIANAPLLSLPAEPIPELEAYFRTQLAMEDPPKLDLLMDAIDRYGTPALLPDVIRFYTPKEGRWACAIRADVLRFWLRHDPPAGLEALKRALAARERTRCYTNVLSEVLLAEWTDATLPIVTAALDDPDPEVVASAIKVLEAHADAKYLAPSLLALHRIAGSASKENMPAYYAAMGSAHLLLQSTRWTPDAAQKQQLQAIAASRPK